MTESIDKKAENLCIEANIKPYCKRIHFYFYNLDAPAAGGDANGTKSFLLQDAVAALLRFGIEVNKSFVYGIAYYKRVLEVTHEGQRYKIVTESENVPVQHWESSEALMKSRIL